MARPRWKPRQHALFQLETATTCSLIACSRSTAATTFDKKFRAFDKKTGKLLWETTLPYPGNATPATYEINGRQYVVIAASGAGVLHNQRNTRGVQSGAKYVAFALPNNSK